MDWILSSLKLPKKGEYVLIYRTDYFYCDIARYAAHEHCWWTKDGRCASEISVPCWMPLPEEPPIRKK